MKLVTGCGFRGILNSENRQTASTDSKITVEKIQGGGGELAIFETMLNPSSPLSR